MRIAHAVARTLACAYATLAAVACAPREQPGPFTAVHVETTNERIVLQRADNGIAACKGACDSEIPSGAYRVVGPHVSPSQPFVVEGARATFHVDLEPAKDRPQRLGRALTIAGSAALGVGALFGIIALASLANHDSCSGWFCLDPSVLMGAAAGIVGGVGVLMLVPGIVLLGSGPTNAEATTVHRVAGLGLTGIF